MKDLGYGKNYQYDLDTADGFSGAGYFPGGTNRETCYQPTGTATRSRSPSA